MKAIAEAREKAIENVRNALSRRGNSSLEIPLPEEIEL